jgi:hypothetical protein
VISSANRARHAAGFLGVEDTAALAGSGVLVLDPFSTLVSCEAVLGRDVVLWPNTIVQVLDAGSATVGSGAILFPGTRILARRGSVIIGEAAEIGEEGGFTIKADAQEDLIEVGDGARVLGGGSLSSSNYVGRGAQILGPIRVRNCRLADGGPYSEPDPDRRGGVLKGSGIARDLEVPTGCVIQAFGLFSEAPMRRQSYFHPKEPG